MLSEIMSLPRLTTEEELVKRCTEWATSIPPGLTDASQHPIKILSGTIPFQSLLIDEKICCLPGIWDDDSKGVKVVRRVDDFQKGYPVLVFAAIAVISNEEHPNQFKGLQEPQLTEAINDKTKEVIDDSSASVSIKGTSKTGLDVTYTYNALDQNERLDRIFVPVKNYEIAPGIWHMIFPKGASIDAATAGYFVYFEELPADEIILEINADCRFFDRQQGSRYILSVRYELSVSG
jgi:hypothetical protein